MSDFPEFLALSDKELLTVVAAAYDKHQWATVVELTDAWLEARGTMPAGACHFRGAGFQGLGDYESALAWGGMACRLTPLTVPCVIIQQHFTAAYGQHFCQPNAVCVKKAEGQEGQSKLVVGQPRHATAVGAECDITHLCMK